MDFDSNKYFAKTKSTKLHTKAHLLAADLSEMLGESKKFAQYLGITKRYKESDLRGLAKYVLQKKDLPEESRGKYFFGALRGLKKQSVPRKHARVKKSKTA